MTVKANTARVLNELGYVEYKCKCCGFEWFKKPKAQNLCQKCRRKEG